MVLNGSSLIFAQPIKGMIGGKQTGPGGTSYGLGEAGYDIRVKQNIVFSPSCPSWPMGVAISEVDVNHCRVFDKGRFTLASAMEEFTMPDNLTGIVHDKSTWARRGLSVFNTVIEPGWNGFLTLELVYHGEDELIIPAGAGIAQVMFHMLFNDARYSGKYQNQEDQPVPARESV